MAGAFLVKLSPIFPSEMDFFWSGLESGRDLQWIRAVVGCGTCLVCPVVVKEVLGSFWHVRKPLQVHPNP